MNKGYKIMRTRKNKELRQIKFTKDFTKHALGSVLVEFGDTKVITTASVDFFKPKWMEKDSKSGWVSAEYSLLPSSTNTRCKRERMSISGRTQEIQRLIGRSLRACVNLEKMPDITIIIDADVIQADGGTRTASICGGFLALKDAIEKLIKEGKLTENPIIEPIGAISVGIVDGEVRLDLNYEEDSSAQADANIVLTKSGKIIEFQTTAEGEPFSKEQMFEMFEIAHNGVIEIINKY
jgi:ribonuclease PH